MFDVVIAGDVILYVEGVAHALRQKPDFRSVSFARSRVRTLELVADRCPDLLLVDMAMYESEATVMEVRRQFPSVLIVALAVAETQQAVIEVAEAGLAGYVSRAATLDELVATVKRAARGEVLLPPQIAAGLFRRVNALAGARSHLDDTAKITAREMEIVALLDRGLSNKEIACLLGIEVSTVKNHVHNLLEKTQVSRRGEVAARLRHRIQGHPVRTATGAIEERRRRA